MVIKEINKWIRRVRYENISAEHEVHDGLFVLTTHMIESSRRSSNGQPGQVSWQNLYKWFNAFRRDFITDYQLIRRAYTQDLKFGTAGIRDQLAAGKGGINSANIIKLTQAYAEFLVQNNTKRELEIRGILIVGDSRLQSNRFVHLAAAILSNMKIKVFLAPYNLPTPTPFASYAINAFKYIGAIAITASHNVYSDNGYKLYNHQGRQLVTEQIDQIWQNFQNRQYEVVNCNVPPCDSKYLFFVDHDEYFKYAENISKSLTKKFHLATKSEDRTLKITYSSQFGASHMFVPRELQRLGFQVDVVKNQSFFDSQFHGLETTMNPENFDVYKESIASANIARSNIILHTDCDGDRIGVCVYSNARKRWEYLHSTHVATLILLFLKVNKKVNLIGKHLVTSYVSGTLILKIAKQFGMIVHQTATGPKNLANVMLNECKQKCLFAFEQSNGFIFSELLPDKDGVSAAIMIALALEYFYGRRLNFDDIQKEVGDDFGYLTFLEHSFQLPLVSADKLIQQIFACIKKKLVPELKVFGAFKTRIFHESNTSTSQKSLYQLNFSEQCWVIVRESNTERKLKIYIHWVANKLIISRQIAEEVKVAFNSFIANQFDHR